MDPDGQHQNDHYKLLTSFANLMLAYSKIYLLCNTKDEEHTTQLKHVLVISKHMTIMCLDQAKYTGTFEKPENNFNNDQPNHDPFQPR